jgi:transposase
MMPALPSWIIDPLWDQVAAVLPEHHDPHPLGCHRPRIPDRVIFDKLLQVVVFGCAYQRIADHTCSARTLRRRRDEWIAAGVTNQVHQLALPPTTVCSAWTLTISPWTAVSPRHPAAARWPVAAQLTGASRAASGH